MNLDLLLTPAGRLLVRSEGKEDDVAPDTWLERAAQAFDECSAAGLFALAATRPDVPPPASLAYFRDLACRYLSERCRTPDRGALKLEPVAPPGNGELSTLFLAAPPMLGGEYLSPEVLATLWCELDAWVCAEVARGGEGLGGWLERRAPLWHQVGRVCLHLAENRNDPDYPFAFLATYARRLSAGGRVQYQPLGRALEEYAGEGNRAALVQLLSPVHRAAESIPEIKQMVDSGDIFHPLAWTPTDAYRFLRQSSLLEECGLLMRLPDWWRKRPRPRVTVTIDRGGTGALSAASMLELDVGLALGEEQLSEAEWRDILASQDDLVYLKGQWVEVDRERLAEVLTHWKRVEASAADDGLSFIEGMRLLAGAPADLDEGAAADETDQEWLAVRAGDSLAQVLAELRDPHRIAASPSQRSLRATLRPYQAVGRDWLRLLSHLGLGACLADDMGLGKTVQVLALLVGLDERAVASAKSSLLVLPASLLANWKAEIARFTPGLEARFVHPSETPKADLDEIAQRPEQALAGVDLVVTTYGMLLRQDWLLALDWRLVVIDEAQAIKNPGTRQTKAVKRLRAGARIALTGTPLENRVSDLWSLFDFLCPGLLGSATRFRTFVKALEAREHDRYAPLRNLVQPYILRRLKSDKRIIADLPDKTEMKAYCNLTRKQVSLYTREVDTLRAGLEASEGIERRGLVLATLLRLKQICNHPSQRTGDGTYEPGQSGKLVRLREIGEEIAARQQKMLVFTQFREMTEPLAAFLAEVFARAGLVLDGATAVRKRKVLVDEFQRETGPPFMVLSLKAGGVGLNLTAASHVVHFDRWWNPAVENQATDRAFRIGQHRNVVVHKFVCRGTVEERIDALIEDKIKLATDLVEAGGEALLTEMDDAQLLATVSLDIQHAAV